MVQPSERRECWVCQWLPQRVTTILAVRLYDHDIIVFMCWLLVAWCFCVHKECNEINIIRLPARFEGQQPNTVKSTLLLLLPLPLRATKHTHTFFVLFVSFQLRCWPYVSHRRPAPRVDACAQIAMLEGKTTTTITRNKHEWDEKNANIVSNDKNLQHFAISVQTQSAPQPNKRMNAATSAHKRKT